MKKKILSMVLALVLVCGMLPMTVLAAGPDISFTSTAPVGGVAANDTFDVTVSSAEITGAYSIAVKVSFDRNKLEVTNLAWNTTVKSTVGSNVTEANNNGYFSKSYVDNEEGKALEVPANTNFVTATFKVKTGATAGNTDITLTQFSPTNETSAPIPVTIGTPTLSIPITLPANTITVTSDPSRDYNGSAISNPDVSKTSTDGTVSYEWFNDNSGAVGASLGTTAPINAGKYWVKASVTGSTTHADATSEAKVFTISRADYSFTPSVTTNVTVGNSYPTTDATVQGNGAGTEKVDGTLTWYTDSGCTAAATGTFATAGSTTLYWKFTPDSGETNYKADAKTGSTTFSVSALPAQTLSFEKTSITKTYGDAVFTNAVTNDRSDGGTVSYESSNTAVATVNGSGEVTIKGAGKATVTANVTAVSGKYAAGSANYTLTVSPKAITVTVTPATRKFGEANPTFTATVTSGSLVDLDTVDGLGLGLSSPAAAASNVGNYDVVGDGTYNSNYLVTVLGTKKLTVTKADAPTIAAQNISHKYSMSGTKTCAFPAGLPSDRGTTSFALGTEVNTAGVLTGTTTVNATTGEVSYTLASKPSYTAGQSATITVIITMQNYNDVTVNFVISLTDKDVPVLTANALTATYTGSDVPVSAVSGKTAKFGSNSVDGTWSWNGTAPKNAASAAPYTLKFTPTDGTTYAETTTTVSVTINKATPTGAPKYTAITAADKTLADAALTVGTIIPASGTIAWDDTANTKVTANTSYKWTFTPTDTTNYNNLTGSIMPYVVAPAGGGAASSYTLTFNTNGGSAVAAVSKTSGTTVDLTAYKPTRDGYTFAGWFSDAALTKAVASVKLTADTTVYAKWTKNDAVNPFTDVPDDAFCHDAVLWALSKNVTSGTSPTTFSPTMDCSRAQVVTFLWRAMGSSEPAGTANPFTDVSSNAYYYKAVLWAVEKGITKGATATTFAPDDTVTRAQFVTFLWRAANSPAAGGTNPFTDLTDTGAYYYNAVLWAAEQGITAGTSATTFSSEDVCSRGQVVTFLYRYMTK